MKPIYRFWLILIQPADNDTILYFPIRQASLCVLSDYTMRMLSFLFFLSYCIPFCVKVRLPVLSIRLFLFLYFIFYFLWWMTLLMVLIVIDSIMNVYIQHEIITQSGCSDCLLEFWAYAFHFCIQTSWKRIQNE